MSGNTKKTFYVEVKGIRAASAKNKVTVYDDGLLNSDYCNRALTSTEDQLYGIDGNGRKHKLQNISFQQTKPGECDFVLGFVVFLDTIRVYLVPMTDVSSTTAENDSLIPISNQHRNVNEGHLTLNYLNTYKIMEIKSSLDDISNKKVRYNLKDFLEKHDNR